MAEGLAFRGRRPVELAFGTSGLRGLVTDMTDLEVYVNTSGFLAYLSQTEPDVPRRIALGGDRRPSTDGQERSLMRAVAQACADAGFEVENAGRLPTPALAHFAFQRGLASIMVTGSHIPFDRNGIKFNMPGREVLKSDEAGIVEAVLRVRAVEYAKPESESRFDAAGTFRPGQASPLPPVDTAAERAFVERYADFFPADALGGLRIAVYQHSAVGRDLLVEVLERLGATVYPVGRSEQFVAIDTEAIDSARLAELELLYGQVLSQHGPVDALVSTDGDSDRPLVLGVDAAQRLQFVPGDLLGILVAEYLGAAAIAVPVSATDAIERHFRDRVELVRTKIGSPWVIAAMLRFAGSGRVGFEANGGFLLGSELERDGRRLAALPTRDAFLPLLSVLHAARIRRTTLVGLCAGLPERYGSAGLIDVDAPPGALLTQYLVPPVTGLASVRFPPDGPRWCDGGGVEHHAGPAEAERLLEVRARLAPYVSLGVDPVSIESIDFVDGIRCSLESGDIVHLRASGNAPQLRLYAVSDSREQAQALVAEAVRPGGTLTRLMTDLTAHDFVCRVQNNIGQVRRLFDEGTPAQVIGTVSGSPSAQRFWQKALDEMKPDFRAEQAISFHEDLPTNQAFGLLLLWQRLRQQAPQAAGALVAFVFGEGSRATPFTETDNGQKPAMASFVRRAGGQPRDFESMVGLALRCFAPVESYLRRSGFDGLVVKWGDEVQIPALDLSRSDPLFDDADVVRFVSMRRIDEHSAKDKDWVGVDAAGRVTAFIPRRPLGDMLALAERGLLQQRGGELFGGVNLGSIAVSRQLLDALLAEFSNEVNDATADRKLRPDLDPQFFSVFMTALIADDGERRLSYERGIAEVPALAKLDRSFPELLERLRKVVTQFERRHGRAPRVVAMDFGDQYWGDIGQHRQIYEFYMALNRASADGHIARSLAGLTGPRNAQGNWISADSVVAPGIELDRSVLIGCELSGRGVVRDSVLIGTRAHDIRCEAAFDVLSVVRDLTLAPRAGSYRVISEAAVEVPPGERVTTLFLPDGGQALLRVAEDTDLRDRSRTYDTAILGNPLSFAEAHRQMQAHGVDELRDQRARATAQVLEGFRTGGS